MSVLIKAFDRESTNDIPIWLMRQAGRYLPEYKIIRKNHPGFLSLVYTPKDATEVTLQPVRRFGMDGAILFSDILVIPQALGYDLRFIKGEGPVLSPVREKSSYRTIDIEDSLATLMPIMETIRQVKMNLPREKTMIGFAGAPWTVLCYMVQGHGKCDFPEARKLVRENPDLAEALISDITDLTVEYLIAQAKSGAEVLQIFDSWAILLKNDRSLYDRFVVQAIRRIIKGVKAEVPETPIIAFPRGLEPEQLPDYAAAVGCDGLSIDHSIDPEWAASHLQPKVLVQGNLDPKLLLEGGQTMLDQTAKICGALSDGPFIFNLGHGVIKETPPAHVAQLVDFVKRFRNG